MDVIRARAAEFHCEVVAVKVNTLWYRLPQSRRRVYLVFANSRFFGITPAETCALLAQVRDIFVSLGDKAGKHPPLSDFLFDDTSPVIEAVTAQLAEMLLSKKAKLDSGSERWVQLHRKKFEEIVYVSHRQKQFPKGSRRCRTAEFIQEFKQLAPSEQAAYNDHMTSW